jgi:outer membrane protein assembly factor BamB
MHDPQCRSAAWRPSPTSIDSLAGAMCAWCSVFHAKVGGLLCLVLLIGGATNSEALGQHRLELGHDFPELSLERDWPWWRGPLRNGIAPVRGSPPTTFNDRENVVWKTPVPGRGHSSPIVVGGQVLLTTADEQRETQSVLAFDRNTGALRWETIVGRGGFPSRNHQKNSEATPTLASDGERVFAVFFHHRAIHVTALDLSGRQQWTKNVGPFDPRMYEYGYAPSPVVNRDRVIVSAEYDGDSALTALQRTTGNVLWRTPRPRQISFSSPVVAWLGGRDQLLLSGGEKVVSYDPASGNRLWEAPGATAATCGTVVWQRDIVVASGGYPGSETVAIRGDGTGSVVWKNNQKCYEQSLLVYADHVYSFTDGGILYCWRLSDGQEMWRERLQGPVSSSPVLAGGNIYWANERGTWYVFRPNPQRFELIAQNQLGDEGFTSAAAVRDELYIRAASRQGASRQEFLYRFQGQ